MTSLRQRGKADADRSRARQPYRAVFDHAREGIFLSTVAGQLLDANSALLELLGTSREQLVGQETVSLFTDSDLARRLHLRILLEGLVEDADVRVHLRILLEGLVEDADVRVCSSDGQERLCTLRMVTETAPDGAVAGYYGFLHDVAGHTRTDERLQHEAMHDSLTHLPNRRSLLDRAGRLLERTSFVPDFRFAVLVLDLDRLKLVNDSMGHRAGDALLALVAERLTALVRPEDIVARLGGDEFAILLFDMHEGEGAASICSRIHEAFLKPFDVLGSEVYTRASIGVALSEGYDLAEDIVRDAGTAMYEAKRKGADGWAVFDHTMRRRAISRLETETALRRALERNEFVLHFQPLVSMRTARLVGFEALVRWKHPTRGLLLPSEFLSVAEESGLILPLGEWVLREACRTVAAWRAEAPPGVEVPTIAVNLSGRQLMAPGFARQLRGLLEEHGLPGSSLGLEITESVFIERSDRLLEALEELETLGITLSLDDFGTGYSTLSHLRDLPVHTVKIDRSFVTRLPEAEGSGMVRAILSIAAQLGLGTVAEGVETEAQMRGLLGLGCDDAQGFLFSVPLEAEHAWKVIESGTWPADPKAADRPAESGYPGLTLPGAAPSSCDSS